MDVALILTSATALAAAAFAALAIRHRRRYQVIPVAGPDGRPLAYVRVRHGHRLVLGHARYSRAVLRGRLATIGTGRYSRATIRNRITAPTGPQPRPCRPDLSRRHARRSHTGWLSRP